MSHTKTTAPVMNRHLFPKAIPVLYECRGCSKLFFRNHHCEASDKSCSDCGNVGHYPGICKSSKTPRLQIPSIAASLSSGILREMLNDDVEERAPVIAADDLFSKTRDPRPPLRLPHKDFTGAPANISDAGESDIGSVPTSLTDTVEVEITHKQDGRRILIPERPSRQLRASGEPLKNGKEETKDLRHKLQMSRKRGRSVDLDDVEEVSEDKSLTDELKHYKSLAASLKEQNTVLLQKHDTLRTEINQLKENLSSEQKQVEKFQAKLKMYRNASLGKTLDRLKEQTERSSKRARLMEDQRNQLYTYTMKLKCHNKKYRLRVSDLVEEYYEYVAPKLYPRYPSEYITPGTRPCINCCSSQLHHPFHCVAQGVTCQSCHRNNHLTAVCWGANDLWFKTTDKEIKLLKAVAEDMDGQASSEPEKSDE